MFMDLQVWRAGWFGGGARSQGEEGGRGQELGVGRDAEILNGMADGPERECGVDE